MGKSSAIFSDKKTKISFAKSQLTKLAFFMQNFWQNTLRKRLKSILLRHRNILQHN